MTYSELCQLKHLDISESDSIVDINEIKTDASLPPNERIEKYLQQVKNPYCYKVDDIVVLLDWIETENTIQNQMEELIEMKLS